MHTGAAHLDDLAAKTIAAWQADPASGQAFADALGGNVEISRGRAPAGAAELASVQSE